MNLGKSAIVAQHHERNHHSRDDGREYDPKGPADAGVFATVFLIGSRQPVVSVLYVSLAFILLCKTWFGAGLWDAAVCARPVARGCTLTIPLTRFFLHKRDFPRRLGGRLR